MRKGGNKKTLIERAAEGVLQFEMQEKAMTNTQTRMFMELP